jgi:pyridoxal phosphate enzyme (YggS family)
VLFRGCSFYLRSDSTGDKKNEPRSHTKGHEQNNQQRTTNHPKFAIFNAVADTLWKNFVDVKFRIEAAAKRAGRDPREIKLVAVSKTHPAETIREAIAFGQTVFGENKVQEAEGKIEEIGRDGAEWHLIGHLQSNKARRAVQLFDVIHSLDSLELARRLERICIEEGREELRVLVQVDVAREATKSGITKWDLPWLIEFLIECERLKFEGFMILPPFSEDLELSRYYFRKLRALRDEYAAVSVFSGYKLELSMGMSHDFEAAIEEGATIVRVGTAIFGERNTGRKEFKQDGQDMQDKSII